MKTAASAPGKVVLSGEYAVLDGAPALAMAVDCRAHVVIETHSGNDHIVETAGSVAPGDFSLFDAVCHATGRDDGPLRARLDTRSFVDPETGVKLGTGSSAALAVALTHALLPDSTDRTEVFDVARRAHREFQEGRGSGIDVATSWAGGVLRYSMTDSAPVALTWPDGLDYALLWSGVSASTNERVDRLERSESAPSRAALADAAASVVSAWEAGSPAAIVDVLRDYVKVLERFNVDHGLGIFEAGHAELAQAAPEQLVYKPCGAGGGDIGIVIGIDGDAVDSFARAAGDHGFRRLDLRIDNRGVSDESLSQ